MSLNDEQMDKLLRELTREEAEQELASLRQEIRNHPVRPSEKFDFRMRQMISREQAKAKRNKRRRWAGNLSKAAAILIVLCLGVFLIAGQERIQVWAEQVQRVMVSIFRTHTEFDYQSGEEGSIDSVKRLSLDHLPEGYAVEDEQYSEHALVQAFVKNENLIVFDALSSGSAAVVLNSEGAVYTAIDVNGIQVRIYKEDNHVIYHWEQNGFAKTLVGDEEAEVMESLFEYLISE